MPRWHKAVINLHSDLRPTAAAIARDFLLLLLFTGLRKTESASLAWENVDFDERTITIPQTKNGTPLILPTSTQIETILRERRTEVDSAFVFPGRGKSGWLVDSRKFLPELREKSGVNFTHHDLRRTFLTIAEGIDIPHYALKRLANHRMSNDITAGYIVTDVERLRAPMQAISDDLERLCKARWVLNRNRISRSFQAPS